METPLSGLKSDGFALSCKKTFASGHDRYHIMAADGLYCMTQGMAKCPTQPETFGRSGRVSATRPLGPSRQKQHQAQTDGWFGPDGGEGASSNFRALFHGSYRAFTVSASAFLPDFQVVALVP
jgi:hypothetical protein